MLYNPYLGCDINTCAVTMLDSTARGVKYGVIISLVDD